MDTRVEVVEGVGLGLGVEEVGMELEGREEWEEEGGRGRGVLRGGGGVLVIEWGMRWVGEREGEWGRVVEDLYVVLSSTEVVERERERKREEERWSRARGSVVDLSPRESPVRINSDIFC